MAKLWNPNHIKKTELPQVQSTSVICWSGHPKGLIQCHFFAREDLFDKWHMLHSVQRIQSEVIDLWLKTGWNNRLPIRDQMSLHAFTEYCDEGMLN